MWSAGTREVPKSTKGTKFSTAGRESFLDKMLRRKSGLSSEFQAELAWQSPETGSIDSVSEIRRIRTAEIGDRNKNLNDKNLLDVTS